MNLDQEMTEIKTYLGSICSILMIFVIAFYAYLKTNVWLDKQADIISFTQKKFFSYDYTFDNSQGLNIAIAFTAYDEETEDILDPSYGKIEFVRNRWGMDENGEIYNLFEHIETHMCTKEELGLTDDQNLKTETKNISFFKLDE